MIKKNPVAIDHMEIRNDKMKRSFFQAAVISILQHPTKHQLYSHLPPITKTIQVRWTRHAGHCWRSRDELISDVLLWTHTYGRAKAGRPARTYIQQLCENTGCSPEDLPETMNDREKWGEKVSASGTTWWWWRIIVISYLKPYNYKIFLSTLINQPLSTSQMWHKVSFSWRV